MAYRTNSETDRSAHHPKRKATLGPPFSDPAIVFRLHAEKIIAGIDQRAFSAITTARG